MSVPRIRMFAGPNGSGKSTIKSLVQAADQKVQFGFYINPDDIEKQIRIDGYFDFAQFALQPLAEEVLQFFSDSSFLKHIQKEAAVQQLTVEHNRLKFGTVTSRAYLVSVLCDFLRHKLLQERQTFTFETVMSESGKVAFLKLAQEQGYRTYLYYVATIDPQINISRVKSRVGQGGHDVPEDKIVSRYYRSPELLWPAIQASNRSFLFDNSFKNAIWFAETEDQELVLRTEETFNWFENYVMAKSFGPESED